MAGSLSLRRRMFVEAYLRTWNGTKSAMEAGYAERGAHVTASRLLQDPKVAGEIQRRIAEAAMSADEVLLRLAGQARASVADFLVLDIEAGKWRLDLEAVRRRGHLLHRLRQTRHGVDIELYDAQAALVQLGRHFGLFRDNVEIADWRGEVMTLVRDGKLSPDLVRSELGEGLAQELFESAGVRVAGKGEDPEGPPASEACPGA